MGETGLEPRLEPRHKVQAVRLLRWTRSKIEVSPSVPAFEENLQGEPQQALESDVLGELCAAAGAVGCGDRTTVVIDADTVLQIDLHHVEESENDDDDDPRSPIVDDSWNGCPSGPTLAGVPHVSQTRRARHAQGPRLDERQQLASQHPRLLHLHRPDTHLTGTPPAPGARARCGLGLR
jgi:hypothetical protein